MIRDWTKESYPLDEGLVRELFRDAGVLVGKATSTTDPQEFGERSIASLRFDAPPLPQRPNLERESFYYAVAMLLLRARIDVLPRYFSYAGWMDAGGGTRLKAFIQAVLENQYARDET